MRSLEDIVGMRTSGPGGRRKGEAGHDVKAYEVFVDLIRKLLRYDPRKSERLTALAALRHPFFVSILPKHSRTESSSNTTNTSSGDSNSAAAATTTGGTSSDQMDLSGTSEPDNSVDQDDAMDQDSDQATIKEDHRSRNFWVRKNLHQFPQSLNNKKKQVTTQQQIKM